MRGSTPALDHSKIRESRGLPPVFVPPASCRLVCRGTPDDERWLTACPGDHCPQRLKPISRSKLSARLKPCPPDEWRALANGVR